MVEYRIVGSDMYDEMLANISHETAKYVLGAVPASDSLERKQVANPTAASHGGDDTVKKQPVKKSRRWAATIRARAGAAKSIKNAVG